MSVANPTLTGAPRNVQASMAVNTPPQAVPPPTDLIHKTLGGIYNVGKFYVDALRNAPADALDVGKATVNALAHPVDTANAAGGVVRGLEAPLQMAKVTLPNGQTVFQPQAVPETADQTAARTAPANALGKHYSEAYGSIPKAVETMRTKPISTLLDASTVLGGGGGVLAKAPGLIGKIGEVAGTVGKTIDPLTATGNALAGTAKAAGGLGSEGLGFTTGAGARAVGDAYGAGVEGGKKGAAFVENMRGAPVTDVVDRAKGSLDQVRQERSAAYKAGKADLSKDATVLDFAPIDTAVTKASEVGAFKGKTIEPAAVETVDKMRKVVEDWKGLDPAEYHTPEGIDALKRSLGNLRDATQRGTPERVASDRIYNAVRGEIADQVPGYSKMMEDYAKASDKLKETEKTFSLGERATGDTAARKLLSATRDNVQTNFGQRARLLDELAKYDPTLPYAIAGQAMNSLMPRGLVGRGGLMAAAPAMAAHSLANPLSIPLNVLAALAFSPRVVGETAHLAGRAVGGSQKAANALRINAGTVRGANRLAYQGGRLQEQP